MRAAQELLGVPTIVVGSAQPGGGGGGSQRSQISQPSTQNVQKWRQNGQFIVVNDLKNAENAVFYFTVLNKIYSRNVS